jgi:hypothetical protein
VSWLGRQDEPTIKMSVPWPVIVGPPIDADS